MNCLGEVLVDLVSSDSESEDIDSFTHKIWSKFTPNAFIQMGFPPGSLLPPNIPFKDSIYELDLKNKSDCSDLELEYFVDELTLSSNDTTPKKEENVKSWKQWREFAMQEARDVRNESLLGNTSTVDESSVDWSYPAADAFKKLYLWEEENPLDNQDGLETNLKVEIAFDVFPPNMRNVSKKRLKSDVSPCCRIVVVR